MLKTASAMAVQIMLGWEAVYGEGMCSHAYMYRQTPTLKALEKATLWLRAQTFASDFESFGDLWIWLVKIKDKISLVIYE